MRAVIDAASDAAKQHRMMASSNANMKNSIETSQVIKNNSTKLRSDSSVHTVPASRRHEPSAIQRAESEQFRAANSGVSLSTGQHQQQPALYTT